MEIIDAQVHVWERQPERPWDITSGFKPAIPGFALDDALNGMNAVGIDAAILSLPPAYRHRLENGAFRYDNSYAEEASQKYPGRFASVINVDPEDPEAQDIVAHCRSRPGTLGLRLALGYARAWDQFVAGKFASIFHTAERFGIPVMMTISGHVESVVDLAGRYPDLAIIVDHLGLKQPPAFERTNTPFSQLETVLALAAFENLSVKLTGVPTLSHESYPFGDLWPHLRRAIDVFGMERLMWGSDITRVQALHSWSEALGYIRFSDELSDTDKAGILGGNLRRILRWESESAPDKF